MLKLPIVMVLVVLLGSACGNADDESASPSEPQTTMADHASEDGMADMAPTTDPTTCAPQGNALAITAEGTAFNVGCLAAPAGQAFTIAMENKDSVAHSLAILASHEGEDVLLRGDIFQGPKSTTYEVSALSPGTYAFHCEVHPATMKGTFVVA